MIRKDLGKDAVILSTKRVNVKKWLGLWRSRRIEVLAAVGEDVPLRGTLSQFQQLARQDGVPVRPSAAAVGLQATLSNRPNAGTTGGGPVRPFRSTGSAFENLEPPATLEPLHPQPVVREESRPAVVIEAPAALPANALEPAASEAQPATVQPMREPTRVAVDSTPASLVADVTSAPVDMVRQELSDVRRLLELTLLGHEGKSNQVVQHLLNQGLHEDQVMHLLRASVLVQDSGQEQGTAITSLDSMRRRLSDHILQTLAEVAVAQPIRPTSRVIAFVGPTGVGKTTTIAKLAALHVLAGQRKVGLITSDTYRIAAVEQLRTYGSILNIPLEVVYRSDEIPGALERMSDRDLILIDTAGRNFRVDAHVQEVAALLQTVPVDETYLVLSVTSKPDDLDRLAAAFCSLPVDKFLFTKLDETSSYGAILNLLLTHRKPISYVTTGQNVPDDIEIASLVKLLSAILGGAA